MTMMIMIQIAWLIDWMIDWMMIDWTVFVDFLSCYLEFMTVLPHLHIPTAPPNLFSEVHLVPDAFLFQGKDSLETFI